MRFPFRLIFWGQTQITSGLASILNGATGVTGVIVAGLLLSDDERLNTAEVNRGCRWIFRSGTYSRH